MGSRRLPWLVSAVGVVLALSLNIDTREGLASELTVRLEGGKLSMKADGVPVKDLLPRLEEEAGVKLRVPEPVAAKPATFEFEGLPLEQAVHVILRELALDGRATIYAEGENGPREIVAVVDEPSPDGSTVTPRRREVREAPPERSEPEYIPPEEQPEYIPPKEEPEFIPYSKNPEYIPPKEPPQEVPAKAEGQPSN